MHSAAVLIPLVLATAEPLIGAHAHNDYHHARPLLDALDHGFGSIEADIFLKDGRLLVGHAPWELRPTRTLESLYLEPLVARARGNGGRVYPGGPPVLLFVDIKADGAIVYGELQKRLEPYRDVLSGARNGRFLEKGITIVLSGSRPVQEVARDPNRLVTIDGRLGDPEPYASKDLSPVVSESWGSHFRWRGKGAFPPEERKKLAAMVQEAHARGRLVRFWGTPESESFWKELRDAGVDLINTDQLDRLERFLRSGPGPKQKPAVG